MADIDRNVPSKLDSTKHPNAQRDLKSTFLTHFASLKKGRQKDLKRTLKGRFTKMLKNENKGKDPKRTLKGHKGHKKDLKRCFITKLSAAFGRAHKGGGGLRPPPPLVFSILL